MDSKLTLFAWKGNFQILVDSICYWNSQRYAQLYDKDLTIKLLDEEFNELAAAVTTDDTIEIVDAYCDIFYVAIGAMWKLGKGSDEILAALFYVADTTLLTQVALAWYKIDDDYVTLARVALSAFNALANKTDTGKALNCIKAVCDSNDSKTASMTDPTVKANIDKGEFYFEPTERLKAILERT